MASAAGLVLVALGAWASAMPSGEAETSDCHQPQGSSAEDAATPAGAVDGSSFRLLDAAFDIDPAKPDDLERARISRQIQAMARSVRSRVAGLEDPGATVAAMREVVFEEFRFSPVGSKSGALDTSMATKMQAKRGGCVLLVILYLALGDDLGIELEAAAASSHLYVIRGEGRGKENVELLRRGELVSDQYYVSRYGVGAEAISRGLYLAALPRSAIIASLASNQGVMLLDRGDLLGAIERFDMAIRLYPHLEAALLNRGIALVAAGRHEEAWSDFTGLIEGGYSGSDVLVNRAITSLALGRVEDALDDLAKAWAPLEEASVGGIGLLQRLREEAKDR